MNIGSLPSSTPGTSGTSGTNTGTGAGGTNKAGAAPIRDTIIPLPVKAMSMIEAQLRVDVPSLANVSEQYQNIAQQFLDAAALLNGFAQNIAAYGNIANLIAAHDNTLTTVQSDVDTANTDGTTLNDSTKISTDNSEISDLNNAIDNYTAAKTAYDTTPNNTNLASLNSAANAYNSQRTTYLTYINGPRATDFSNYNNDADAYNADLKNISDINNIGLEFGLPPLTLTTANVPVNLPQPPDQITDPTSPPANLSKSNYVSAPVPTIDDSSIELIGTTQSTNGTLPDTLTNFLPSYRQLILSNATSGALAQAHAALYGVQRKFIGVPTATRTQTPQLNLLTSPNNPGSTGTAVYLTPFTLSSHKFTENLFYTQNTRNFEGSTNFLTTQDKLNVNIPESDISSLVSPTIGFSAYAAIPPTVARLKANKANADNEQFIRGLIALGASQDLLGSIQNGTLNKQVAELVQNSFKDQNLSAGQVNTIVQASIASFNANLLNASSTLLSQTFDLKNLPQQLYGQVLDDLHVSKEQIALITSPNNPTTQDVLSNPLTAPLVKQDVLNQAKAIGVVNDSIESTNQGVRVINKAVNATLVSQPATLDQLKNSAYTNFLNRQNTNHSQALVLAHQTYQTVLSEKTTPLNTAIPPNTLSQKTILNAISTRFPNLANTPAVTTALQATFATQPTSLREFNTTFNQQLSAQKVDFTTAQNISLTATKNAHEQIAQTPPFTPANVQSNLLNASLTASLTQNPGILPGITPPATLRIITTPTTPTTAAPTPITPVIPPVTAPPPPTPPITQANPAVIAALIAQHTTQTALNATPAPTTPADLRENLRVSLVNQNVPHPTAREISENAFISTEPILSPNAQQTHATVKKGFLDRIHTLTGQHNEQLANELTNTLLGEHHSIRSNLRENLQVLNQFNSELKGQLAPTLTHPIYQQIQDTLYKEKITFDATTAPMIITKTFTAHPMFGMPREPIDFPKEQKA